MAVGSFIYFLGLVSVCNAVWETHAGQLHGGVQDNGVWAGSEFSLGDEVGRRSKSELEDGPCSDNSLRLIDTNLIAFGRRLEYFSLFFFSIWFCPQIKKYISKRLSDLRWCVKTEITAVMSHEHPSEAKLGWLSLTLWTSCVFPVTFDFVFSFFLAHASQISTQLGNSSEEEQQTVQIRGGGGKKVFIVWERPVIFRHVSFLQLVWLENSLVNSETNEVLSFLKCHFGFYKFYYFVSIFFLNFQMNLDYSRVKWLKCFCYLKTSSQKR